MASKLNQPSIVTRRKKRDLESTMKSLKKLLEPSSGSRKKNIPRSISKKISQKKTRSINRFESYENSSEDGEYYPNKLKRKDIRRKIVLKPKHDLKVVIATNKRKRGTPLKGVKSLEEKLTVLNTSNALPELSTLTETELPTQTTQKPQVISPDRISPLLVQTYTNITKYELISPPHRSLTELTVDDLMRMDEDSLSEDDLMEVLTCPSPVWWEDPPDYFSEGVLYLNKTGNLDVQNEVIKETADKTSIINLTRDKTKSKRPENARETKKTKKIAKLEDILGNIKNRVNSKSENIEKITDQKITNDKSKDESVANYKGNEISNVTNRTDDKNKMNHNLRETRARNALKINVKDFTKDTDSPNGLKETKRRKISSSGSDISINDEDLLRNLENINIPIHNVDTDCTVGKNDSRNFKDNDGEPKAVTNVKEFEIQRRANKDVAKPRNEDIDSNKVNVKSEKDIRPKKPTDDILDVRLLKIPTNATNEVRVWSKVENFQRHNWKPEDFHEVIDIENELVFSMIKCNNQTDPETICIDDDDEQIKETIDLDAIGKANDKLRAEFTDMVEITRVNDKANIKEDTIIISKDLDVRLIETPVDIDKITEVPVSVDLIPKPEQISQKVIKKKAIEPTKPKKQSKKDTHGIKILPMNIPEIPNSNTNKKTKKRSKKHQQNSKEKTNGKTKGIKIINNKNEKVIRINDLDISIIQVNDHNIERNETPAVKNDLCITLVSDKEKNERKDVPSKKPVILPPLRRIVATGKRRNKGKEFNQECVTTPVELPKLTKNPGNKVESPKSINSISSDAEGTISDTNIQFLDEYDDKRSVDIVFEGETIGVDDNVKSKDIAAEMCIVKQIEENSIQEISVGGKKDQNK